MRRTEDLDPTWPENALFAEVVALGALIQADTRNSFLIVGNSETTLKVTNQVDKSLVNGITAEVDFGVGPSTYVSDFATNQMG